jgi:cation-transporting P-type ATPase F
LPGDVVILQTGDKVSADMRLIKVRDLQIDESSLTGESMPVEKTSATLTEDTVLSDRHNMAYSSTLITYGSGLGVVIAIGDTTEIGKISTLITTTQSLDTPLTKRIKQFSQVLLYAIVALSAVTVLAGWFHGIPILDAFMAAVALTVSAIPEGLPAAVTIILAIGVSRMAKRRAIIRNLPAVETLGSTTVICSDKTGTLTKNEMTVTTLWAGGQQLYVTGNGYNPEGEFQYNNRGYDSEKSSNEKFDPQSQTAILETLRAGLLCNEAELHAPDTENSQWRIVGDPTEAALLVAAHKAKLADKTNDERLDIIPFQSEYQYMATLHRGDEKNCIYLKGSLESLLSKSNTMLGDHGQAVAIDLELIQRLAESMAAEGLRVLAFARKSIVVDNIDHDMISNDLEFLGLQAMIDPPRPEVALAVAACHRAGIKVKMITGDHALTAVSIAKQLGIIDESHIDAVVTGRQLTEAKVSDWPTLATERKVFARVTPENKLALVKTLQEQGEIVAMTGDRVNDAPALRRADIGIAMALNGTEVAKEAADMMLTDDNFATITAAVEEGRGVFDNLKKFIVWTLPTNGGEGLAILLAILLGLPLPLLPIHVLWINMTTSIFLGLMLAFEPKEAGIMRRPPNRVDAPIIDGALLWRIVLVSSLLCLTAFGLYNLELLWGKTETEAQTVAAAMFVVGEAFYLMNCRSLQRSVFDVGFFSNPWIWVGIAIMGVSQLAFTYLPIMNEWFQTAPISFNAWLRILASGLLISVVVGLDKKWRSHQLQKTPPIGTAT